MTEIRASGKRFVDTEGRERIFNGVNLCDKGSYDPETGERTYLYSYPDNMFSSLADKGVNLIRLGIIWDAIEPQPGQYNEAYLDHIKTVLDRCEEAGIYVYLDMHQDLYSDFDCGAGDGAPDWACLTDGKKYRKPLYVWAEGYFFGGAVHRGFDNFWANAPVDGVGLQDRYAAMWAMLAKRFGGHPALFGYDLMNEPFPGSDGGTIFRKLVFSVLKTGIRSDEISKIALIKNLFSGNLQDVFNAFDGHFLRTAAAVAEPLVRKFDRAVYTPFLSKVSEEIRKYDKKGILFIDNCYYSNLSTLCAAGPIMVGGKKDENVCFAPHGYDFMVDTPLYKYAANSRADAIFTAHALTQTRLNVPVIVGEWGGNGEGTGWLPHIRHLYDFFDSHFWSNTYWCFFSDMIDWPIMDEINRIYPAAVTGKILSIETDRENRIYTLKYYQDCDYFSPTVIRLPSELKKVSLNGTYTLVSSHGGFELEARTLPGENTITVEW